MARPKNNDGVIYQRPGTKVYWMRYTDKTGKRFWESTGETDWDAAHQVLRERLQARDNNSLTVLRKGERMSFTAFADYFLEQYSQPPMRAPKTHIANTNALKALRPTFGEEKLADITAEEIEAYLRGRLRQRKHVKTRTGVKELGIIQPATAHQEFRVLRRILNVAVKKKLLTSNPCTGVEFPARIKTTFRPHYVRWSEQQKIEAAAPRFLKNIITIITETGLRIYRELAPLRKEHIDVKNAVVFIPDSKTTNGIAEVPLTERAVAAFADQLALAGPGPYLFPSPTSPTGYQTTFKKVWRTTLKRAGVPYFRLYDLRSTYATRLSAGGVPDEWVTQLLRQGNAQVLKRYSQMKLQLKREALNKMHRTAGEAA